jgi:hypothetical protein
VLALDKAAAAEARGDVAEAAYWRRLSARVDLAPPLTQAQKDRLRVVLAIQAPAQKQSAA